MKQHDDALAAVTVTILLILTAWGNAIAMLIVSTIGLIVGLVVFRGRTFHGGLLAATVGLAVAAAIAIAFLLGRSG